MKTDVVGRHLQWMKDRGLSVSYIRARELCLQRVRASIRKPLTSATERDLERWRASLGSSPDWSRVQITHVREFYRWCHQFGHRKTNPGRRLAMPRKIRRYPRPIDYDRLTVALGQAPRDIRLMIVLAAWLGLRASELAGLRWESVYLPTNTVMVTWQTAKGRKEREIPVCEFALGELRAYGVQAKGWVFPRADGQPGPNRPWRISQIVNEYLHGLGMASSCHTLRHFFGTELLALTGNLRLVQELMGHEDPATTAIYTKVRSAAAAAAVAGLPVPA